MEKGDLKKYSTEDLKKQSNVMKQGEAYDLIIAELWRRFQHIRILAGLKIT